MTNWKFSNRGRDGTIKQQSANNIRAASSRSSPHRFITTGKARERDSSARKPPSNIPKYISSVAKKRKRNTNFFAFFSVFYFAEFGWCEMGKQSQRRRKRPTGSQFLFRIDSESNYAVVWSWEEASWIMRRTGKRSSDVLEGRMNFKCFLEVKDGEEKLKRCLSKDARKLEKAALPSYYSETRVHSCRKLVIRKQVTIPQSSGDVSATVRAEIWCL